MDEATKNDIKFISVIALSFALFILFTIYVPDESFWKKLMAGVMVGALVTLAILFTPIGNPLKKLYRNWKAKKTK